VSARRGIRSRLITGTLIGLVVTLVGWPSAWPYAAVFAAGAAVIGLGQLLDRAPAADAYDCAGCTGCGGPDCLELTADEARQVAADLGIELYRAQDALAFVGECCDIADREGTAVTTADVRAWLGGPQCARQAGLVLDPADLSADATGEQA
jgi:hypothetical protein